MVCVSVAEVGWALVYLFVVVYVDWTNGNRYIGSVGRARNALMFYKENYALTLTLILAYSAMT